MIFGSRIKKCSHLTHSPWKGLPTIFTATKLLRLLYTISCLRLWCIRSSYSHQTLHLFLTLREQLRQANLQPVLPWICQGKLTQFLQLKKHETYYIIYLYYRTGEPQHAQKPTFSKHPHGTLMQAQAPHAGTLAKRMVCRHCAPATIKSKTSLLYIAYTMTKKMSWQNCHCWLRLLRCC